MTPDAEIRLARASDLGELAAIELAAAATFRDAGIDGPFLEESESTDTLAAAMSERRLWVAVREGRCAGFALVELLDDDWVWLEEIDVHPLDARRGLGRALVERVIADARARGARFVGLSTFRNVAWNAPFYARLGFRELAAGAHTPAIRSIVEDERSRGLLVHDRLVMRFELA